MNDYHEKTHIKTNSNTDSTTFSFNAIDKSTIEDLIKCDMCNIIFDLTSHEPLMLKCGHTFCKRCISYRTNNPEKNINKMCPLDKKKNVMCLDLSIPNLKLESIIKKLSNLNILNTKKHMVYSKPAKKSISPIKSNSTAMNTYYINNAHNNVNVNINNNIKNNEITNVNIINKGKEPNTQINIMKSKVNVNINKKNQNNKTNNINLVNTIKNKILSVTNINNVNNKENTVNNVNNNNNVKLSNDINKLNLINKIPSNGQMQTISSGLNELNENLNLNTPKIGEEMNIEEENFKKGMNNETIDTIPFCEEKIGDTSFGGDINELLWKTIEQKKIFFNEEPTNEELSSSLKELNLMGNQDSLNISLTNSKEDNNNMNMFKINKANLLDKQNTHQIRTIYDKIKSKLNSNGENQKDNNNSKIINNITNSIIIFKDDNINIITDNSSSQSQEKILRNNVIIEEQLNSKKNETNINNELDLKNNNENNENELIKINQININKNNFFQDEQNIKINPIINKNVNINLNKELKVNENSNNINNINTLNDKFSANAKLSKIGIHKHIHSNSDDYNEELNKKYLKNYPDVDNKLMTINPKKIKDKKGIDNQEIYQGQNLNNSFDSGSKSNSVKNKLYSPGNNLSKSFVNLSGNNWDDLDDNIKEEKNLEIEKMKKNLENNKFMTINTIKSSKSHIEKIKNNIYYESQNKNIKENKEIKENNNQIHPIITTKKNSSNNNVYNNNVLTEIRSNSKEINNNFVININSNNIIEIDKENALNLNLNNNNKNINKNINSNNITNDNTNISKSTKVLGDQILKKNSKTNETYKKLKAEFDLLLNERNNLIMNKNIANTNTNNNIHNLTNNSVNIINSLNKLRKKEEEAFQNYFKNPKYKIDQEKTKIKFFQNNHFFIGILDPEEKFPIKGILVSSNGDYYDGEFVNGKKEGEGKLIYANGNQYEGSFLAGFPNGHGKLIQTDNDIYEGEWKNGKINGQGTRLHNNGDKYIGNHLNDVRSGKGLYLFVNGDSYNGYWVNGKANGKGVLKFRNGDIYDGEFKDNCIFGKGTFKKKNGDIYIGDFKLGLINGLGKYINILGEQYIGEFLSGKKHGSGKLYNKEGKLIQSGIWKNDKYYGNAKYQK